MKLYSWDIWANEDGASAWPDALPVAFRLRVTEEGQEPWDCTVDELVSAIPISYMPALESLVLGRVDSVCVRRLRSRQMATVERAV